MKTEKKANKGSVLILTIIFLLIITVMNIGLYFSAESNAKLVKVKEVKHMKSYYAAVAGLRYAKILLETPAIFGFTELGESGDPSAPESYVVTGNEFGGDFFQDIGVATADLTITITEINSGPNQGEYEVKAVGDY